MATKTIQLGSGVAPIGSLFTFERITTDDTASSSQRITRGLFSGNAASLATFFTSSAQSASSGDYYYDVYDKVGTDSTREVQFSVTYGHALGSGSIGSTAAGIGFADHYICFWKIYLYVSTIDKPIISFLCLRP